MENNNFEKAIDEQLTLCRDVLIKKNDVYSPGKDRLATFKRAGIVQNCTPVAALSGMMTKHTISVYTLIEEFEKGTDSPMDVWEEKISDLINYLLLLKAILVEKEQTQTIRAETIVTGTIDRAHLEYTPTE